MPSGHEKPRRIRVALDTTFAGVNPTGVGLYSRNLAATLRRMQRDAHLSVRCYGPACSPKYRATHKDTLQELPLYTQCALPLKLASRRPDLVHSTSHLGPVLAPGKLVVTVHDLIFRRCPQDYDPLWLAITRALLPVVLRRAAAIIADSHATSADIRRYYGFAAPKVKVIYPGVDEKFRAPPDAAMTERALREFGVTEERYILCLGPWARRKNLDVVVRAFGAAHDLMPDVGLVVTGEVPKGMKGPAPGELVRQLPPEARSRVHLVGYVSAEELRALMSGAMLLAYPSRIEGFGLPPLEAMAAGVPVVASRIPVLLEVTAGAALYADPDSPHEWAARILEIVTNPDQANALRQAGRERSALFSWHRCAQETAHLYRQVVGSQ